jgi:hypothetical protein
VAKQELTREEAARRQQEKEEELKRKEQERLEELRKAEEENRCKAKEERRRIHEEQLRI